MDKKQKHQLEKQLLRFWPLANWQNERILVALSGGADSVGLLRLVVAVSEQKEQIFAAHFNHGLRALAKKDEQFVEQLCHEMEVPLFVGETNRQEIERLRGGEGIESIARAFRYDYLISIAKAIGARYIATAHHADDQAETILHNILRGTGINGLRGIPKTRRIDEAVSIVRPLLKVSPVTIRQYLADINQPFREDDSNHDPAFVRNRIRHELLPFIEDRIFAQAKESLLRLSALAADSQLIVGDVVMKSLDEIIEPSHCVYQAILDVEGMSAVSTPLRREILIAVWKDKQWPLKDMGSDDWNRILRLSNDKDSKQINLPGGIFAFCKDGKLVLSAAKPE